MLKTNPLAGLGRMPRAWKLFRRGRMPLRPHRIRGVEELKKSASTIEEVSGLHAGTGKAKEA